MQQYEIEGQQQFNAKAAKEQHHLYHLFERWEALLLKLLIAIALAFLAFVLAISAFDGLHPDPSVKGFIKNVMSFSGIIIPALGAVLLGIRAQGDFLAYSERAEETAVHLKAERQRITRHLSASDAASPGFEDLLDIADASVDALSTNVYAWRSVYRRKVFSVAA